MKIPHSVTEIGCSAFSGYKGLKSVTIPNSVTTIGDRAFESCISLKSVTIPNSVTKLVGFVFSGCTGLRSVTIGRGVKLFGGGVFLDCPNIRLIKYYRPTPPEFYWGVDSFDNDVEEKKAVLMVPANSVRKYRNDAVWGHFRNIRAVAK